MNNEWKIINEKAPGHIRPPYYVKAGKALGWSKLCEREKSAWLKTHDNKHDRLKPLLESGSARI